MSSRLRTYILRALLDTKGYVSRQTFFSYYSRHVDAPTKKDQGDAITGALEAMIAEGMLIARGVKTKEKWYIQEVQFTPAGRRRARLLVNQQQRLPLRVARVSHAISDKKL